MPPINPASVLESPHAFWNNGNNVAYAANEAMLKASATHMTKVMATAERGRFTIRSS